MNWLKKLLNQSSAHREVKSNADLISLEQLSKIIPHNKNAAEWLPICNYYLNKYGIISKKEIAAFLSQAAHESSDFTRLEENLNYSWERLREVFPRYFTSDDFAKGYHRQPEKIANRVYSDALRTAKLGNTSPGDGWLYRGRGIIQLTGKANYAAFGKAVGMSAEQAANYCGTKRGAFESACWFWSQLNLSALAESGDITAISKAINGGDIGVSDRINRYNNAKRVLNV